MEEEHRISKPDLISLVGSESHINLSKLVDESLARLSIKEQEALAIVFLENGGPPAGTDVEFDDTVARAIHKLRNPVEVIDLS